MKKVFVDGWKSWRNLKKEVLKDELIMHTGLEHRDALFMLIPVENLGKFETALGKTPFTPELCDTMRKKGISEVVGIASKEYLKMEGNDYILNGLAVCKEIEDMELESMDFVSKIEGDVPIRKKGVDFAVELPKGDDWMLYASI